MVLLVVLEKLIKKVDQAGISIIHRGPDEQKYVEGKDWSIKFNRLSIIDLSKDAMQPFSLKGIDIFVNGEIYNYLELKNKYRDEFQCKTSSDIEILPFLYVKYGINFLNELNGMFSMVIIDKIRDKKYLVRDRFGKKPLYYFLKENILYFSSELKALTNFIKLEVDKENLAINFISNLNPEPLTPYKGIFSVLPGNLCIYKNKSIETFRWYSPKILENNSDNINEIEKKFYDLASSSIDLRLRSDVPVGVFLSGGIDSNLIFNLAFKKNKDLCAYICNIPNKKEFSNSTTDVAVSKKNL